jgi:ubiquinone biosynthesis protein Coq4
LVPAPIAAPSPTVAVACAKYGLAGCTEGAASADSVRAASADSLMAVAYPTLNAVQNISELGKVVLPLIESMKALKVDPKDIQFFKKELMAKKHELDSLAKLSPP